MSTMQYAQLFDGQSAASQDVKVEVRHDGLVVTDRTGQTRQWTFADLKAASPFRQGHPLRLKHSSEPNSRLLLEPGLAVDQILLSAKHVKGGITPAKAMKFAVVVVVCLAAFSAAGYAVLNFAPDKVAAKLPPEWRDKLANHTERTFIGDKKQCTNFSGTRALNAIVKRVAAASPNVPKITVRVFDMPFVNAFALPGGRIVLTGKLIEKADSPEEVAGVIAHEIGHSAFLHPEASLVRGVGLQLLINLATGGSGGDTIGGFAGLLTMLQYSRDAERQADDYAVKLLSEGSIDPEGLRYFFEKLNEKEWKILSGKWAKLSDMMSTHPGTEERIEFIRPLPAGTAKEVVTPQVWKQLKKICS